MDKFMDVLRFFRLVDDDGKLSLTNVSTILALCNLLFAGPVSYEAVAAFVASLVSYQAKRFLAGQQVPNNDEAVAVLKEQIAKLQTSVAAVQLGKSLTGR